MKRVQVVKSKDYGVLLIFLDGLTVDEIERAIEQLTPTLETIGEVTVV